MLDDLDDLDGAVLSSVSLSTPFVSSFISFARLVEDEEEEEEEDDDLLLLRGGAAAAGAALEERGSGGGLWVLVLELLLL